MKWTRHQSENELPYWCATRASPSIRLFVVEQADHTFSIQMEYIQMFQGSQILQLDLRRKGFANKAAAMTWCDKNLQAFSFAAQNLSRP